MADLAFQVSHSLRVNGGGSKTLLPEQERL